MVNQGVHRPVGSLGISIIQRIFTLYIGFITYYLPVDAIYACAVSITRSVAWWLLDFIRNLTKRRGFKIFQTFLYVYTFAHVAIGGFHTVNAVNQLKPIDRRAHV